jgi:hypothetical protein
MKKIFGAAILIAFSIHAFAQTNLVKNPSFEDYYVCPHSFSLVSLAKNWSAIVDTSVYLDTNFVYHGVNGEIVYNDANCFPQFCNICDNDTLDPSRNATTPNNEFFHHFPRTGSGLMFVDMYENYNSETSGHFQNRAYLQGRLFRPLVAGKTYCVTYYVVLAGYSCSACNHMGVYFDDGTIDTTIECGHPKTEYTPQVLSDSIVTDTTNWTMMQGSFTAIGTERFLTIGNFFDSAHTSCIQVGIAPGLQEADYLIDDVSVIAVDDTANAGPDAVTTPMGDSMWVGDTTGYLPCYWYVNGVLIDSNKAGFKVLPDTTTTYVLMLNVCGNVTYDSATVYVFPTGVGAVAPMHVLLYPNPASTSVTLEGARGCGLTLTNALGQVVYTLSEAGMKETIPLTGLAPGVYTLVAMNSVTGERVVRMVMLR